MPEGYRHLTHEERCQIGALKESGLSDGAIAARLGRDRTTVWRELRRNGGGGGYSPGEAQGRAEARRGAASSVPRRMTPDRWAQVEGLLAEGWSPEQVAGRLRLEGGWTVGRQWIYERVKADRKAGGRLFLLLRRRGRKPNWRGGRHSGRGHIPGRVDISERPEEAERKERVGDWEADTIIGKGHSGAVVSLVDRASKYTYLQRVDRTHLGRGLRRDGGSPPAVRRARPHDHGGQRQGVRGPRRRGGGARGRVLFRHPLPFLGAWPERAHQRAGAAVPAEGDGPPRGQRRGGEGGAGPPERASAPGAGLPDARRGAA